MLIPPKLPNKRKLRSVSLAWRSKPNVNSGAFASGHPPGCTGAKL
ncbi:MAG: hypothetical protein KDD73_14685, partial [Anaerolineales bacterium]|nr:hypothetical protein [Anaerolineales bacterium]